MRGGGERTSPSACDESYLACDVEEGRDGEFGHAGRGKQARRKVGGAQEVSALAKHLVFVRLPQQPPASSRTITEDGEKPGQDHITVSSRPGAPAPQDAPSLPPASPPRHSSLTFPPPLADRGTRSEGHRDPVQSQAYPQVRSVAFPPCSGACRRRTAAPPEGRADASHTQERSWMRTPRGRSRTASRFASS